MDTPILPDNYYCSECLTEVEEATFNHEGRNVCNWCRVDYNDTFYCEGDCNTTFEAIGIPVRCPTCESLSVAHLYADTNALIYQKQIEIVEFQAIEPLETPIILEAIKEGRI